MRVSDEIDELRKNLVERFRWLNIFRRFSRQRKQPLFGIRNRKPKNIHVFERFIFTIIMRSYERAAMENDALEHRNIALWKQYGSRRFVRCNVGRNFVFGMLVMTAGFLRFQSVR